MLFITSLNKMKQIFILLTGLAMSISTFGQKKNSEIPLKLSDSISIAMPQVIVIGRRDGMINKVTGSGSILNNKEI